MRLRAQVATAPAITAATRAAEAVTAIQNKKGYEISVLDLRHLEHRVADYFVVCAGTSDRQTQAIADEVRQHLKASCHELPYATEGVQAGEWILLDYGDVVIHIFLPRVRAQYALEELWGDAYFTHPESERLPEEAAWLYS